MHTVPMSLPTESSGSISQPLEKPAPAQRLEDSAILEQCHRAGYERIPASEEFDDLLAVQVVEEDM